MTLTELQRSSDKLRGAVSPKSQERKVLKGHLQHLIHCIVDTVYRVVSRACPELWKQNTDLLRSRINVRADSVGLIQPYELQLRPTTTKGRCTFTWMISTLVHSAAPKDSALGPSAGPSSPATASPPPGRRGGPDVHLSSRLETFRKPGDGRTEVKSRAFGLTCCPSDPDFSWGSLAFPL
ncbi:hypothetical protein MHYP_G00240260 [Metynnis hypsauchen]